MKKIIKLRYRSKVDHDSAREADLSRKLTNLEQHYYRPPQDPGVET